MEDSKKRNSDSPITLKEQILCRICLNDSFYDESNPILSPCKCKGTMGYIHLKCLKLWIEQRIIIVNKENSTMISWKSLNCELCKEPYPFAIYFNEKIHELIECKLPEPPYVIFEQYHKESMDSIGLCIASFSKKRATNIV